MSVYGVVVVGTALDAAARREVAALAREMTAEQSDVQQTARQAAEQAREAAMSAQMAAREAATQAIRSVHPQIAGQIVVQDPSATPPVAMEAPGTVPKVSMAPDGSMTVIGPDGTTTIIGRDGRYTVINARGQVTQSSTEQQVIHQGADDEEVVSAIALSAVIAFFAGRWWARRRFRRGMAKNATVPSEIGERMERIEQAVEAIAIEVERVSEGQRFTTRLLSEQLRSPVPVAGGGERRA